MMAERPPQGAEKFLDRDVVTSDGAKLGVASKLLKNRISEVAEWLVVESGLLGRKRYVVPLAGSELGDDIVVLAYKSDLVHAQPHAEPDDETDTLTAEGENALNVHFGLGANGGAHQATL